MAKASEIDTQNRIKNYSTKDKINKQKQWGGFSLGREDVLKTAKKLH